MNKFVKVGACSALALAITSAVLVDSASAYSRRGAALGVGIVAGAIIAGAAVANSRERVYVREAPGCGEYRRRAVWNEQNGNGRRAAYWWDRFEDCRGG
jgi:hypothetical protein